MKRFTILFSTLLILGFAGVLVYVGMLPEFVPPAGLAGEGEDPDAPIWDMTMDELLAELEGQGLIETANLITLAADGISTVAVKVTNGAEIFWWDLENLKEDSMEYEAYKQMKEEGVIDFYGAGRTIMPFTANGPFGLMTAYCESDAGALEKGFKALGQGGGAPADDPNAPVWSMDMADMMDYLEEKGFWNRDEMLPLSGGVATEAYVCNNVELYWWDVDNLEEGSNEEAAYQEVLAGEPINLDQQGQHYMAVTKNGPFAIFAAYYTGDVTELLDAFSAFGWE